GLDVESARNVRMLLRELVDRAKKTILFTSHNMQEVEMLCDRMAVINRGKIIFLGTPRELREKVADMKVVEIRLVEDKGVLEDIIKKLEQLPVVNGILSKEVSERNIVIRVLVTDYFTAIPEITSTLREYNIESVQRMLPTLEEAFLKLAGTEPRV
ncbi:MAG: ABC transporter ATP-binding protein, partial [Crenarchaeota archaeon]|nr:ABC transporter ATP-binding protein [Thermoproteota archaeon]